MNIDKSKRKNLSFLLLLLVMILPQTRLPIQVFIHKGIALFAPSSIREIDRVKLDDFSWLLENQEGQRLNFGENKGEVILINFWATWCPPCIAEMPSLEKLYNDYKGQIKFVFISSESRDVIDSFLKKKNYSFEVYNNITKEPKGLETTSIPRTLIIDKEGNIIIDKTGASNWNSSFVRETIDSLLK